MGGLGAALGFIVLWEMLNRSIRRPVELSQHLGIQPIITIPYIRTAGERRWRRWLIGGRAAAHHRGDPAAAALHAHASTSRWTS